MTTHLYGQEINPETYAICKPDIILRGKGESADHIVGGAEWSTLSHDAFPAEEFDFMLSNPPYGKSWKKDLETLGGKDKMRDLRFRVMHDGEELSLVTRSSDGQMLFLANMASKMNHDTPRGSRVAEVHNGSSLFTGDAGQGESNIRRWLIENDWVEAIVAAANRRSALQSDGLGKFARDCCSRPGVSGGGRHGLFAACVSRCFKERERTRPQKQLPTRTRKLRSIGHSLPFLLPRRLLGLGVRQ